MIKRFNEFANESVESRRFPLSCDYTSTIFGIGEGTSMVRLERKPGSSDKDFKSDVDFLNKINFLDINTEEDNGVIEITISKESSQKLLEYYIMAVNS